LFYLTRLCDLHALIGMTIPTSVGLPFIITVKYKFGQKANRVLALRLDDIKVYSRPTERLQHSNSFVVIHVACKKAQPFPRSVLPGLHRVLSCAAFHRNTLRR
jgi:hypothetical protein